MVLGLFDFASYEATPIELHNGDVLVAYSDGLTEAENSREEMFGEDRVKEIIRREAPAGVSRLNDVLISSIAEFTKGRDQSDDITMVIAQRP
jgi:sigma-B regulation protein RsbU (phosphoserine phosphatase)